MPKDGELFRVFTLFEPEKCFRWKAFILSKQINSCPFRGYSVKLDGLLDAGIWKLLKNLKPKCLCLLVDTSTGSTSVLGKHKAWLWLKVWATELTTKVFDEVHPMNTHRSIECTRRLDDVRTEDVAQPEQQPKYTRNGCCFLKIRNSKAWSTRPLLVAASSSR